jgi:hypothetical protein
VREVDRGERLTGGRDGDKEQQQQDTRMPCHHTSQGGGVTEDTIKCWHERSQLGEREMAVPVKG